MTASLYGLKMEYPFGRDGDSRLPSGLRLAELRLYDEPISRGDLRALMPVDADAPLAASFVLEAAEVARDGPAQEVEVAAAPAPA